MLYQFTTLSPLTSGGGKLHTHSILSVSYVAGSLSALVVVSSGLLRSPAVADGEGHSYWVMFRDYVDTKLDCAI